MFVLQCIGAVDLRIVRPQHSWTQDRSSPIVTSRPQDLGLTVPSLGPRQRIFDIFESFNEVARHSVEGYYTPTKTSNILYYVLREVNKCPPYKVLGVTCGFWRLSWSGIYMSWEKKLDYWLYRWFIHYPPISYVVSTRSVSLRSVGSVLPHSVTLQSSAMSIITC